MLKASMLNLKHLYYFFIFSQELNIAKAAKRLGISSPTLSNQLGQLEAFIGAALTRRVAGKFAITDHGKIILHYAEKMFTAYEELNSKVSIQNVPRNHPFRVGFCRNLGARFSFDLLSLITKESSVKAQNTVILFESSEKLIEGFLEGYFDIIIGAFAPRALPKKNSWVTQNLTYPVRLFAPESLFNRINVNQKKHISTQLHSIIDFAQTEKISLVLPTLPSVLREETRNFLEKSKMRLKQHIECNSSAAIVQLIERGLAIGFVPIPSLLDFKSAKSLIVFGPLEGFWNHEITIYVQKELESKMTEKPKVHALFSEIE